MLMIPSRAFDPAKAWMLDFNGINNGVTFSVADTATALNGASKVGLSFVFKADSLPASDFAVLTYIINNATTTFFNVGVALDISSRKLRGVFRSHINDSAQVITAADDLATGQWHKVVVKIDFTAKTAEIILNGTQVASGSSLAFGQNTLTLSTGGTLANSIGYSNPGNDRWLDGQICDVSVWRDDIPVFGNQRLHGREKGLAIYHPFLDKTGTTLKDWSNNKADATIIGASWQRGV